MLARLFQRLYLILLLGLSREDGEESKAKTQIVRSMGGRPNLIKLYLDWKCYIKKVAFTFSDWCKANKHVSIVLVLLFHSFHRHGFIDHLKWK